MKMFINSRSLLQSLAIISATAFLFSCGGSQNNTEPAVDSLVTNPDSGMAKMDTAMPLVQHAEATIANTYPDTAVSGTVKFDATDGGKVKMVLELTVPSKAGKNVAVHIHDHGDCGDSGMASHGHWNPTNAQHGKWGTGSFHLGDIGNVKLDSKGKGTLTMETDLWSLGGGADKNVIGHAIIVHGGEDDYKSQPSGNAGSRIGCGIIQ
jgi:Cu-Zn family superoxide dismutase